MLIRLIVENFCSFHEATEFNTLPSSRSHNHEHHKVAIGHATTLRMSAIYGANGAGKSNLISALDVLSRLVAGGSLKGFSFGANLRFMFSADGQQSPCGIAIEFCQDGNIFYYHIEFTPEKVVSEKLLLSTKTKDEQIFARSNDKITLNANHIRGKKSMDAFLDGLERLLRPDMLFLSFMAGYYKDEMPLLTSAYDWFDHKLNVVRSGSYAPYIPHLLDIKSDFSVMVNDLLPRLSTGISRLRVNKTIIKNDSAQSDATLSRAITEAYNNPGKPQMVRLVSQEMANVVYEGGQLYMKTVEAVHEKTSTGTVAMPLVAESDGTRRLIDYMPLFYRVMRGGSVYVVDEIERSVHPMLIKALVEMVSKADAVNGQLIFTTHETCLLDQNILRPDEIWFAQKDALQATQLYPLSDYSIHKTANIENGYLAGRYGGIPFLSNLKDLHTEEFTKNRGL